MSDNQILTETCSALRVEHACSSRGSRIAVFFNESIDLDQTVIIHSNVMAYNQDNRDSDVFRFVENDNLVGSMEHLALGRALIKDCDEDRRSLLHVSIFRMVFGRG